MFHHQGFVFWYRCTLQGFYICSQFHWLQTGKLFTVWKKEKCDFLVYVGGKCWVSLGMCMRIAILIKSWWNPKVSRSCILDFFYGITTEGFSPSLCFESITHNNLCHSCPLIMQIIGWILCGLSYLILTPVFCILFSSLFSKVRNCV